jgi:hypothetical protein
MAEESIIRGITYVNEDDHNKVSDYKSRAKEGEEAVHVVEMPTWVGYDGRLMVFGRFIMWQEHMQRMKEYMADPKAYLKKHIENLAEPTWHS